MDYSKYANSRSANPSYPQYPPGYTDPYAQEQQQQQHNPQQYEATPPAIRNPFAPPPSARSGFAAQNASFDPEYEAQVAQWQATYASQDPGERSGGRASRAEGQGISEGGAGGSTTAAAAAAKASADDAAAAAAAKKHTVVRKGGGQTWEDQTLLEWDPTQFRIMVGNLAGEVTDESLAKAFAAYGVAKARVVRDKRTTKSRGYGFVSFVDGELGFKAAREMVGKYIGSHPVTIQRSKTDIRPVVQKDRYKGKNGGGNHNNNNNKHRTKPEDPLRAQTGAHIEKKPVRNPNGMKMLG